MPSGLQIPHYRQQQRGKTMYQAYRSHYAPIQRHVTSQKAILRFLLNHPKFRVPCAPARSDFATALEDVKRAEKNGYYAQILVVEGEK